MNAITLLKEDHRALDALFHKFEALGDGKAKQKRSLVDKIIRELSIHAGIEEKVLYPYIREEVEKADDDVLEAYEEHHAAKRSLMELADMSPDAERFDAKVTVLISTLR